MVLGILKLGETTEADKLLALIKETCEFIEGKEGIAHSGVHKCTRPGCILVRNLKASVIKFEEELDALM